MPSRNYCDLCDERIEKGESIAGVYSTLANPSDEASYVSDSIRMADLSYENREFSNPMVCLNCLDAIVHAVHDRKNLKRNSE